MIFSSKAAELYFFNSKSNDMRLATIKVPKGCSEIYVDLEDNRVVVSYSSKLNTGEVFCEETGEVEELPKKGDFAIFWQNDYPYAAVCMNYECEKGGLFVGSDLISYDNAVKFRNYEQYLKIRGIYGED